MTLAFAQRCAERLTDWLTPFCERIAVAGSIRRGHPTPNDIDLVCIPRIEPVHDLFGNVSAVRNLLVTEIERRLQAEQWTWLKRGDQFLEWAAKGVQVDLWQATADTWGSILLCRTGSKRHNVWLASRALALGGRWLPHQGVRVHGELHGATEHAIYRALGIGYLEPGQREDPATLPDQSHRCAPESSGASSASVPTNNLGDA